MMSNPNFVGTRKQLVQFFKGFNLSMVDSLWYFGLSRCFKQENKKYSFYIVVRCLFCKKNRKSPKGFPITI